MLLKFIAITFHFPTSTHSDSLTQIFQLYFNRWKSRATKFRSLPSAKLFQGNTVNAKEKSFPVFHSEENT